MNTANGIREARRHAGLSQQQLAQAAGCSAGYIRLLERGFDPRFSDVVPRVLEALRVSTGSNSSSDGER